MGAKVRVQHYNLESADSYIGTSLHDLNSVDGPPRDIDGIGGAVGRDGDSLDNDAISLLRWKVLVLMDVNPWGDELVAVGCCKHESLPEKMTKSDLMLGVTGACEFDFLRQLIRPPITPSASLLRLKSRST